MEFHSLFASQVYAYESAVGGVGHGGVPVLAGRTGRSLQILPAAGAVGVGRPRQVATKHIASVLTCAKARRVS
jgi:hypothetical protein